MDHYFITSRSKLESEEKAHGAYVAEHLSVRHHLMTKDSHSRRIPLLKMWEHIGATDKAEDIEAMITKYFSECELMDQWESGRSCYFTFRFEPHPDSPVGRNLHPYRNIPGEYTHLKITTKIEYDGERAMGWKRKKKGFYISYRTKS